MFVLDLNALVERALLPIFFLVFLMGHPFCLTRLLFFAFFSPSTLSSLLPDDRSKGHDAHFSDPLLVSRCVSRGTRRAKTVPSILISCSAEAGGQPLIIHLTLG